MDSDIVAVVVSQLVVLSPVLVAYLSAIIVAVVRYRLHPKPSALLITAAVLGIVLSVSSVAASAWIPMAIDDGLGHEVIGVYSTAIGVTTSLLASLMWVLIILAVVVDRQPSSLAQGGSSA